MSIFSRIFSYSKTYKLYWILTVVGFLCAAFAQSLQISMIAELTSTAKTFGSPDFLSEEIQYSILTLPFKIFLLFVFLGLSNFIAVYFIERIGFEVGHKIRIDYFKKLQFTDIQFIKNISTGEMLSKLIFNIEQMRTFYSGFLTVILRDALGIIAFIGAALYQSWELTLVFFTVFPFIAFSVSYSTKFFRKYNRKVQKSLGVLTETFNENVKGQEVIRVFTQQDNQFGKFSSQSKVTKSQSIKVVVTKCFSILIVNVISGVGLGIVIWASFNLEVEVGKLVAVFTALVGCARPFKNLSKLNDRYNKISEASKMVFSQMDLVKEQDSGTDILDEKKCDLSIKNLEFTYPESEKTVLDKINIEIRSGQTVALVGRSGSGKSTLIQLIVRLYNAQSGCIQINNQSIDQLTLHSLRSHIALVTQQPIIFAGTLYDNIAFGQPHANEENVKKAAIHAHVWEFAEHMDGQLQTMIQADGSNLSGGQKQRIAIARAFLKDAPILLLDEATSALDNQSEAKVQQALNDLMQNKTTLVIAHRLSTIKNADKIIVLENGQIKQSGHYEQLSQQDGLFKLMLNQTE
ncbi:ABC transporter ATP-binding protein [Marinicellulosiphila megalodicopiae]|uniref:ABC transporter ATP-binding protein n=1 Tax=Marinicellulosiphila megalodicopiae TaxID=2724896 RepID=UPI003BB12A80